MLSLRLVCSGHRRGDTAYYRRDTDEPDALTAVTDVTAAYTVPLQQIWIFTVQLKNLPCIRLTNHAVKGRGRRVQRKQTAEIRPMTKLLLKFILYETAGSQTPLMKFNTTKGSKTLYNTNTRQVKPCLKSTAFWAWYK